MRHLFYNVRYSVVPINSSLLNTILHSSVRTALANNDINQQRPQLWMIVFIISYGQSNSVITSWKGPKILCRYKRVLFYLRSIMLWLRVRKYLVPQIIWRYIRSVALTDVVITGFDFTSEIVSIITHSCDIWWSNSDYTIALVHMSPHTQAPPPPQKISASWAMIRNVTTKLFITDTVLTEQCLIYKTS